VLIFVSAAYLFLFLSSLAPRLFRFVAAVCLGRVELEQERARRAALARSVVRERVQQKQQQQQRGRRNELMRAWWCWMRGGTSDGAGSISSAALSSSSPSPLRAKARSSKRRNGSRRGSQQRSQSALHLELPTAEQRFTQSADEYIFSMLTAKGEQRETK
jgi:Mg-chelatase subunit ChlI